MKMISREDLKQRVMGHFCGSCSEPYKDADILELGEYCCDRVSDTMAFIDELPTIEAEPVKYGRWVEKEAYEEDRQMGFNFQIVCSNCDEQNSVLYFDENSEPTEKYFMRTPWCPWCGARMDGDDE